MNKYFKESRNNLLTHQKNNEKNINNKQRYKLVRLKSQENSNKSNKVDIKAIQNKKSQIYPPFNKNSIIKKTIKKISKRSIAEMLNKKYNPQFNNKLNIIHNNTSQLHKRFLENKGIDIEQGNDIGRDVIIKSLFSDIKIRNIINLWNELEVNESYRNFFFFIYNELNDEEKSNLYHKEINEIIQLKNDIKNLTYNIELRIGIINKLGELNDELNNEYEDGNVEQKIINQMFKKMEDLTIQAVNIVQYMKKIKSVINLFPNLNKYDLDLISRKFNFDKNYLIKMKFETDFLQGGCINNFLNINIDQAPFLLKAIEKKTLINQNKSNNKVLLVEQKVINDINDCSYFIYMELISYQNEKMSKKSVRTISPIRKNTSAYNFFTNINFYTHEYINRKEKLIAPINDHRKKFINGNSLVNSKKDSLNYTKMNNSARNVINKDLFNSDNLNNNKILINFDEKFKQINSIKLNKKKLINLQRNNLNDSGMILPKKYEQLKINQNSPFLNNDDILQANDNDVFNNLNNK